MAQANLMILNIVVEMFDYLIEYLTFLNRPRSYVFKLFSDLFLLKILRSQTMKKKKGKRFSNKELNCIK